MRILRIAVPVALAMLGIILYAHSHELAFLPLACLAGFLTNEVIERGGF